MTTKVTSTGHCNRPLHNGTGDSVLGNRRGWLRLSARPLGGALGRKQDHLSGSSQTPREDGISRAEAPLETRSCSVTAAVDHAALSLCLGEGVGIFRFLFLCFARCPVFGQVTAKVKHVDAGVRSQMERSGPSGGPHQLYNRGPLL